MGLIPYPRHEREAFAYRVRRPVRRELAFHKQKLGRSKCFFERRADIGEFMSSRWLEARDGHMRGKGSLIPVAVDAA